MKLIFVHNWDNQDGAQKAKNLLMEYFGNRMISDLHKDTFALDLVEDIEILPSDEEYISKVCSDCQVFGILLKDNDNKTIDNDFVKTVVI